jgi:hypothetical protein
MFRFSQQRATKLALSLRVSVIEGTVFGIFGDGAHWHNDSISISGHKVEERRETTLDPAHHPQAFSHPSQPAFNVVSTGITQAFSQFQQTLITNSFQM